MITTRADRRIFVDTSAYYAAVDRRDESHAAISAPFRGLIAAERRCSSTKAVLFELHALLLNRLGREVDLETLRELRVSQTIVRVRDRDETRADDILAHDHDKTFSLTDAPSFAVMGRFGISVAPSLDRHDAQFGGESFPVAESNR